MQDPITWKQAYVIFISLATVGLWCANSALDKYVGQMGIVAIIPMVFFFGFGLLNKASRPPRNSPSLKSAFHSDLICILFKPICSAVGSLTCGKTSHACVLVLLDRSRDLW